MATRTYPTLRDMRNALGASDVSIRDDGTIVWYEDDGDGYFVEVVFGAWRRDDQGRVIVELNDDQAWMLADDRA